MDTGLKTKFNYQTRLFFLIIVFTWILTFAFFTLQYTREKEYKVDTLNTELQMMNLKILYNIESHGYHIDEDFINDIAALDSVRVTVIDLKGDVMDSLALLIQSLPPHAWFFIRLDQLHLQVIIIEKGLPASGPGGSSQIQGASFFIFAGLLLCFANRVLELILSNFSGKRNQKII